MSCIQTSDHRFGATTDEYQILDKFAQKYGWFEIRSKCPRGEGLLSAFWLHRWGRTLSIIVTGRCWKFSMPPGYAFRN